MMYQDKHDKIQALHVRNVSQYLKIQLLFRKKIIVKQKKSTKTTSKSTIWSLRRGKYGRAPLKGTGRELQYEFNTYFQKIEKNTKYKDASSRYLNDKVYCLTL